MVSTNQLPTFKLLLTEGLEAAGYLKDEGKWESYHGGERLLIRDLKLGAEREGAVVIADKLNATLLMASALSNVRNLVIIGNQVAADVDLGKVRAERLRHAAKTLKGDNYWAVYVVEGATLISIGSPFSSSRLAAEILRAQVGHSFEQRKVCAECGALNPYRGQNCTRCGARLVATGRLNRWMHYDDEETILRKLEPEEEKKLVKGVKDKFTTPILSWREETAKRTLTKQEKELRDAVATPTVRAKKPTSPAPEARPKVAEDKPRPVSDEVPPETRKLPSKKDP